MIVIGPFMLLCILLLCFRPIRRFVGAILCGLIASWITISNGGGEDAVAFALIAGMIFALWAFSHGDRQKKRAARAEFESAVNSAVKRALGPTIPKPTKHVEPSVSERAIDTAADWMDKAADRISKPLPECDTPTSRQTEQPKALANLPAIPWQRDLKSYAFRFIVAVLLALGVVVLISHH